MYKYTLLLLLLLITGCSTVAVSPSSTADNPVYIEEIQRVQYPINPLMAELTGGFTTLNVDTTLNSYDINVTSNSWSIGDQLQISGGSTGATTTFYRGTVLAVTGSILTMDSPLDAVYNSSTAAVFGINTNMAVDGSVTPRIFQAGPVGTEIEAFISRIIIHCVDGSAGDDSKFCGGNALTRGLLFRYSNGITINIWNVKTNGDLIKLAHDLTYSDKVGGGNYGVGARITYAGDDKHGTYLYLYNDTTLEMWVQDDLSGIDELTVTTEGHFKIMN